MSRFVGWLLAGLLLGNGRTTAAMAQTPDTLTTMTGLRYVALRAGTGEPPRPGNRLTVHYTGRLQNGDVFDSTTDEDGQQNPFRFRVGRREVIPGWDEGFLRMRVGERGVLLVPPHLAYGTKGTAGVPPNATLIFEVELLHIR